MTATSNKKEQQPFDVTLRVIGGDVYTCAAVYGVTRYSATIRFIHMLGYRRADVIVCH